MDNQRFIKYVEVFNQLYRDNKIEIAWKKDTAGFKSAIDLEHELPKIDSSFSEEEFIKVAFDIVTISKEISSEIEPNASERDKYHIVAEIFLNDELKEHIFVLTNTTTNILYAMDYEILTKRSNKKPNKVITHSALINLLVTDAYKKGDDFTQRLTLELSKSEIQELITELNTILTNIKSIDQT